MELGNIRKTTISEQNSVIQVINKLNKNKIKIVFVGYKIINLLEL